MNAKTTILVAGSANVDFVIQTQTLPRAGETIGGGVFSTVPGGKGANQALAAQRLGAAVRFAACVGQDAFADIALSNLIKDGVDISAVSRAADAATGAAFINVSEDGENQIAVASGANAQFAPIDVSTLTIDAIIAQLEVSEQSVLETAKSSDAFFCLNTAPALPVSDALFARTDLLIMNETERAFYEAQLRGFQGLIAQTLGADGAVLTKDGKTVAEAKPPAVNVVDTTGAGDTFTGALVTALMEKQPYDEALRFACAAGALATTRLGAQSAMPSREEVLAVTAT